MKRKKCLPHIIAVVALVTFIGLGLASDATLPPLDHPIVGSWVADTNADSWMTFNRNGTGEMTAIGRAGDGSITQRVDVPFTWTVSGNQLTTTGEGFSFTFTYSISGNTLTTTIDGHTTTSTRRGTQVSGPPVVTPPTVTDYSGTWHIVQRGGARLHVAGGTNAIDNGRLIHTWDTLGGTAAQFRFERQTDGTYIIIAVHSGRAWDVVGQSRDNGARIHQWERHNGNSQRWRITDVGGGFVMFTNVNANRPVQIHNSGTAREIPLTLWEGTDAPKHFRLEAVATTGGGTTAPSNFSGTWIIQLRNDLVVGLRANNTTNGTAVVQQARTTERTQHWRFERMNDDVYRIVNVQTNRVLDIQNSRINENGALAQQWTDNGTPNQRWRVVPAADGFIRLQNTGGSGRFLEIGEGGSQAYSRRTLGHQMHQWVGNELGHNSHFRLIQVQ